MTRQEYINHLTAVARVANKSDSKEDKQPWQKVTDCDVHFNRVADILRDMMSPEEYQMWLDTL